MADKRAKLENKAKRFIKQEYAIWLTTVGSNLAPQPRPVWFIWDKDAFLIYSQPHAHKLKHIRQHPKVSLHFNADKTADEDVIVYGGTAQIEPDAPPAHEVRAYMKKYKAGIEAMGATPEQFSQAYSVAIRVKPTSLRGW
ncbi:MAG TPA: TIGR03667 family PPOX class F420-dependent oxidoreductase [Anaerolineales bacterium]|nr:TIGR03667 family PPOX class F420-dependent oxidoreductase [Anaerolineales bacterium]